MKEVESFWNYKHMVKDVAALSGCGYEETVDFMGVRDKISKGTKVLEVGVGLGYVTEGLHKQGAIVSALDISQVSLDRIRSFCEEVYVLEDIEKLPSDYFDVVICNNVVQHVTTDLLIKELKEIIRSLKIGGLFSVEFVSNNSFEDNGVEPPIHAIKNGGLCRTPKFLEGIINDFGGKCELFFDKQVDINIVQGHHVFHVTK